MSPSRKTAFKIVMFLMVFFKIGVALHQYGFRINFSDSVPAGLWRLMKRTPVTVGGYVDVAATSNLEWYALGIERGYYHDGVHLAKKVAALEGDIVSYDVKEKLVIVNGKRLSDTEILPRDGTGRVMPSVSFPVRIKKGEAWLTSENPGGYDSRYFGPVSLDILCPARILVKW